MTYIRRAIKYFIQTCLLLAIILGILMLSGMVPSGGSSPSSP